MIVIEELRQATHKRTNSAQIFVVPRLLWNEWRRNMHKLVDLILDITTGSGYIWPQEMHETLILVIYFSYLNRFPWELRRKNLMVGVGRHMRGVLKKDHNVEGNILSQLCEEARVMDALPFRNLRKLLSRGPRSCFPSE